MPLVPELPCEWSEPVLSVELLAVELLLEFAALVLLLEEEVLPEPADVVEACPDFPFPDPGAGGLAAYAGALSVNPSRTTTPIMAQSLVSIELVQRDDFMCLRIPVELVVVHSDLRCTRLFDF